MKTALIAALMALIAIGCLAGASPSDPFKSSEPSESMAPVRLLTGVPANMGDGDGCFTNAIEGELTVDPKYGTAIVTTTPPEGLTATIAWRPGFTGRRVGSEIEVLDPNGNVVATTGNKYRIAGGGVDWPEPPIKVFWACDFVDQK